MDRESIVESIRRKFESLDPALNEKTRRLLAAAEAMSLGRGGTGIVAEASGISTATITRGIRELRSGEPIDPDRVRRPGAGRKRTTDTDATLVRDLEALIEPTVSGSPMGPLRWTSKSVRKLAAELRAMGHEVSHRMVAEVLGDLRYNLQANRKTREGPSHPDRDAQFHYLNGMVKQFQKRTSPVISVDTKKKELVGDFKNQGREWRPQGQPERVRVHDFMIPELGKAIPYGVYDLSRNEGWVSVGVDHDTASFAVGSIHRWWSVMGSSAYLDAKEILITADCGGSNAAKTRLWKLELQNFADANGIAVTVCHLPPGTSKWNKIEHRMFSYISVNWRGKPLTSLAVIVSLIASTDTTTGLRIRSEVDSGEYPKGIKVSDEEMATINIQRHDFHGDWNYTIRPRIKALD